MKNFVVQLLWILILVSCSSPYENYPTFESNFPLKQTQIYETNNEIQRIAVSDTWMVVYTSGFATAIDVKNSNILWQKNIRIMADDPLGFVIVDDTLVATSQEQVLVVDKLGNVTSLNLESASDDEIDISRVASVYLDTIYLNRFDGWDLEAYSLSQNKRLWNISVGRGSTDVFFDATANIAYITTRYESFFAVDNATGKTLWQHDGTTLDSTYEDGIIYAVKKGKNSNQIQVVAFDVATQTEIWSREFTFQAYVYEMTIIDNLLILSGNEGLLAVNKADGAFAWQTPKGESFSSKPIKYGDMFYAKGTRYRIYAVSPDSGDFVGYVSLETDQSSELMYSLVSGVYKVKNGIIFNTKHAVWLYKDD